MAFVAFQAVFAIITVALISGAIADRARFGPWMVFAGDLGHDRLLPGRPLGVRVRRRASPRSAAGSPTTLKAIDFAGGTAVHINAGAAGLGARARARQAARVRPRPDAAAQPDRW